MSELKKVSGDAGVVGVVVGDFLRTGIGTRSRLGEVWREGVTVLGEVVGRLLRVGDGREECRLVGVFVLVPEGQVERAEALVGGMDSRVRVRVRGLAERPAEISARVRVGRAWGMYGWRGGAGQWTVFDEEYHPRGIAEAIEGAEHVLCVHSHGVMLDAGLTEALIGHHLHKNHEMRVTYTPCAPGLTGMVLQGGIVREMGEKNVMPGQLLGYDPGSPTGDTLIRDACMAVDPALSKVQNRFCVDTERGWGMCRELCERKWVSLAEMAGAGGGAARMVGPGALLAKAWGMAREVELELTGRRETNGPGSVPGVVRLARGELAVGRWVEWISRQKLAEDLLVTVGGDGDPLLYGGLVEVLRAVRGAGVLSVCVQTDLTSGVEGLVEAIGEGLLDVVSVTMYGGTAGTYAKVSGMDGFGRVMGNLERVMEVSRGRGGVPLVVPRLVKVRETIGEMEGFFDEAVRRFGWGVFDGPTDRAGQVEGKAVVSMAPPGRRACRRLWDRLLVRANGVGVACDQDMMDTLSLGNIGTHGVVEMWRQLEGLRERHRKLEIGGLVCERCSEWHRA